MLKLFSRKIRVAGKLLSFALAVEYLQLKFPIRLPGAVESLIFTFGDPCNFSQFFIQDKSKDSKANPLSVKNIGGVFVVLLGGLLVAIIVAVLEFCWNSRKNSQIDRQSLCSEMAEELR